MAPKKAKAKTKRRAGGWQSLLTRQDPCTPADFYSRCDWVENRAKWVPGFDWKDSDKRYVVSGKGNQCVKVRTAVQKSQVMMLHLSRVEFSEQREQLWIKRRVLKAKQYECESFLTYSLICQYDQERERRRYVRKSHGACTVKLFSSGQGIWAQVMNASCWRQGLGHGKALWLHVASFLREAHCECVVLYPVSTAEGFWRHMGFAESDNFLHADEVPMIIKEVNCSGEVLPLWQMSLSRAAQPPSAETLDNLQAMGWRKAPSMIQAVMEPAGPPRKLGAEAGDEEQADLPEELSASADDVQPLDLGSAPGEMDCFRSTCGSPGERTCGTSSTRIPSSPGAASSLFNTNPISPADIDVDNLLSPMKGLEDPWPPNNDASHAVQAAQASAHDFKVAASESAKLASKAAEAEDPSLGVAADCQDAGGATSTVAEALVPGSAAEGEMLQVPGQEVSESAAGDSALPDDFVEQVLRITGAKGADFPIILQLQPDETNNLHIIDSKFRKLMRQLNPDKRREDAVVRAGGQEVCDDACCLVQQALDRARMQLQQPEVSLEQAKQAPTCPSLEKGSLCPDGHVMIRLHKKSRPSKDVARKGDVHTCSKCCRPSYLMVSSVHEWHRCEVCNWDICDLCNQARKVSVLKCVACFSGYTCYYTTCGQEQMDAHMRSEHPSWKRCQLCSQYCSQEGFSEHMKQKHPSWMQCSRCSEFFSSQKDLDDHKREQHGMSWQSPHLLSPQLPSPQLPSLWSSLGVARRSLGESLKDAARIESYVKALKNLRRGRGSENAEGVQKLVKKQRRRRTLKAKAEIATCEFGALETPPQETDRHEGSSACTTPRGDEAPELHSMDHDELLRNGEVGAEDVMDCYSHTPNAQNYCDDEEPPDELYHDSIHQHVTEYFMANSCISNPLWRVQEGIYKLQSEDQKLQTLRIFWEPDSDSGLRTCSSVCDSAASVRCLMVEDGDVSTRFEEFMQAHAFRTAARHHTQSVVASFGCEDEDSFDEGQPCPKIEWRKPLRKGDTAVLLGFTGEDLVLNGCLVRIAEKLDRRWYQVEIEGCYKEVLGTQLRRCLPQVNLYLIRPGARVVFRAFSDNMQANGHMGTVYKVNDKRGTAKVQQDPLVEGENGLELLVCKENLIVVGEATCSSSPTSLADGSYLSDLGRMRQQSPEADAIRRDFPEYFAQMKELEEQSLHAQKSGMASIRSSHAMRSEASRGSQQTAPTDTSSCNDSAAEDHPYFIALEKIRQKEIQRLQDHRREEAHRSALRQQLEEQRALKEEQRALKEKPCDKHQKDAVTEPQVDFSQTRKPDPLPLKEVLENRACREGALDAAVAGRMQTRTNAPPTSDRRAVVSDAVSKLPKRTRKRDAASDQGGIAPSDGVASERLSKKLRRRPSRSSSRPLTLDHPEEMLGNGTCRAVVSEEPRQQDQVRHRGQKAADAESARSRGQPTALDLQVGLPQKGKHRGRKPANASASEELCKKLRRVTSPSQSAAVDHSWPRKGQSSQETCKAATSEELLRKPSANLRTQDAAADPEIGHPQKRRRTQKTLGDRACRVASPTKLRRKSSTNSRNESVAADQQEDELSRTEHRRLSSLKSCSTSCRSQDAAVKQQEEAPREGCGEVAAPADLHSIPSASSSCNKDTGPREDAAGRVAVAPELCRKQSSMAQKQSAAADQQKDERTRKEHHRLLSISSCSTSSRIQDAVAEQQEEALGEGSSRVAAPAALQRIPSVGSSSSKDATTDPREDAASRVAAAPELRREPSLSSHNQSSLAHQQEDKLSLTDYHKLSSLNSCSESSRIQDATAEQREEALEQGPRRVASAPQLHGMLSAGSSCSNDAAGRDNFSQELCREQSSLSQSQAVVAEQRSEALGSGVCSDASEEQRGKLPATSHSKDASIDPRICFPQAKAPLNKALHKALEDIARREAAFEELCRKPSANVCSQGAAPHPQIRVDPPGDGDCRAAASEQLCAKPSATSCKKDTAAYQAEGSLGDGACRAPPSASSRSCDSPPQALEQQEKEPSSSAGLPSQRREEALDNNTFRVAASEELHGALSASSRGSDAVVGRVLPSSSSSQQAAAADQQEKAPRDGAVRKPSASSHGQDAAAVQQERKPSTGRSSTKVELFSMASASSRSTRAAAEPRKKAQRDGACEAVAPEDQRELKPSAKRASASVQVFSMASASRSTHAAAEPQKKAQQDRATKTEVVASKEPRRKHSANSRREEHSTHTAAEPRQKATQDRAAEAGAIAPEEPQRKQSANSHSKDVSIESRARQPQKGHHPEAVVKIKQEPEETCESAAGPAKPQSQQAANFKVGDDVMWWSQKNRYWVRSTVTRVHRSPSTGSISHYGTEDKKLVPVGDALRVDSKLKPWYLNLQKRQESGQEARLSCGGSSARFSCGAQPSRNGSSRESHASRPAKQPEVKLAVKEEPAP